MGFKRQGASGVGGLFAVAAVLGGLAREEDERQAVKESAARGIRSGFGSLGGGLLGGGLLR